MYSTVTGKVRPGTVMMGAPPKYAENRCVSMVADMSTTFRSGRFASTTWLE